MNCLESLLELIQGLSEKFLYAIFFSMEYVGAQIIYRSINKDYSVECDKEDYTIRILYRNICKLSFNFNRFCDSAFVFNSLKKLKDVKLALKLKGAYALLKLNK